MGFPPLAGVLALVRQKSYSLPQERERSGNPDEVTPHD